MTSLFIGRWQPFHEGHKTLIETELKQGNDVVIAVRNTKRSGKNPYSYRQIKKRIKHEMSEWKGKFKIIKIPDINAVCYGRKVGYWVKEIRLDEKTEAISGTKIRAYDYMVDGQFGVREDNSGKKVTGSTYSAFGWRRNEKDDEPRIEIDTRG